MDQYNRDSEKVDLSGALKDSGAGRKLDASGWRAVRYYRDPQSPKVVQWVMRYSGGLIQSEKQANYVLLGLAAVAIITSLFLFFGNSGSGATSLPYEKTYKSFQ
ncbi:MAG: hypothetical protein A3B37_02275 [Candidatus Sungbacteria bacterium RIFCSPLOWO2_01_FULL_59_16]|uniref:Uncharacterized protein n=1 Tax=Candidatus Sungbacteria bacterium RIFCSPLOWO2_01_FULL_59_16 TaxID=1802280 RepID=A0A1G2LCL9_9BACT|nr:MAG: hypothetical protein A3B37_02275 [Candidatus Sungbacteria bacterium RIFCSPLOWO2_01_FULL_59_16]